jgi:hypothetical protein
LFQHEKRRLEASTLDRGVVQRVDHSWLHTRAGDGRDLANKEVIVVGCGSLGGYLGHLLAKAGVGKLTLMDNDALEWDNIGRHVLGASAIGPSKAKSLAKNLQKDLPHLAIESFYGDWRTWIAATDENGIAYADLVVSTVADWGCERPLNLLTRQETCPPIIFGWLEPYAVAGHALYVSSRKGCLQCGVNDFGQFDRKVAHFPDDTLTKEPGGCSYYQQYGPISVLPVASLIADLAVEALINPFEKSVLRSWIGPLCSIENRNGTISEYWGGRLNRDAVSQVLQSDWSASETCEVCT